MLFHYQSLALSFAPSLFPVPCSLAEYISNQYSLIIIVYSFKIPMLWLDCDLVFGLKVLILPFQQSA